MLIDDVVPLPLVVVMRDSVVVDPLYGVYGWPSANTENILQDSTSETSLV
ncbi:MAG TPA: hypothetical protein VEV41_22815 [Terriglobales bacterium]|nr:hypothetical protein [Terriglobales bacterium]HYL65462.1 hypothetical protein [Candidatus Methylomirabilis sp.]